MIVDGTQQFTCEHEYLAFPYGFTCHKCYLNRTELPLPVRKVKKRLFFFPARLEANLNVSATANAALA